MVVAVHRVHAILARRARATRRSAPVLPAVLAAKSISLQGLGIISAVSGFLPAWSWAISFITSTCC